MSNNTRATNTRATNTKSTNPRATNTKSTNPRATNTRATNPSAPQCSPDDLLYIQELNNLLGSASVDFFGFEGGAYAKIHLACGLSIPSFTVVETDEGISAYMPSYLAKDGKYYSTVIPVSKAVYTVLSTWITERYEVWLETV